MAPEQADPAAIPDARWDVYALGAVLHTMLEGRPPHHSDEAVTRHPRRARSGPAAGALPADRALGARRRCPRRKLDKPLAQILARCLAVDPRERFSTVQEVLEALRRRREGRARRPMVLLGGLGPVLLLAVMAVFGLRGYRQATEQSADAIRKRAFESNQFAAAFLARSLEGEFRRYFEVVSEEAAMPAFLTAFRTVTAMPELHRLAALGPERGGPEATARIEQFLAEPSRRALDAHFRARLDGLLGAGAQRSRARPASSACSPWTPRAPTWGRRTTPTSPPSRSAATSPGDRIFTAARRTCPATRPGRASPPPCAAPVGAVSQHHHRTPGGWGCRRRCSRCRTTSRCSPGCWCCRSTSASSSSWPQPQAGRDRFAVLVDVRDGRAGRADRAAPVFRRPGPDGSERSPPQPGAPVRRPGGAGSHDQGLARRPTRIRWGRRRAGRPTGAPGSPPPSRCGCPAPARACPRA